MTWQSDCQAQGGFATVFPYDVPLTDIFPGAVTIPGASLITVPGFPACRTQNGDGTYAYTIPNSLGFSDRYAIVEETLGDEAMASFAQPLQALADAGNALAQPFEVGALLAGIAAVGLLVWLGRKG